MTPQEAHAIQIAIEVFEKKCQSLAVHRNPSIYLKDNAELFSDWFEDRLSGYNTVKLGANAHPDIILNGVGFELKSLKGTGQIQFNSTIPCGGFQHGSHAGECFYAVARYSVERNNGYLQDFTICDGDFFNHNRQLAFSHANSQETEFGDYEDGVVRHRKMYSFPSPLRQVKGVSLISKFDNLTSINRDLVLRARIERTSRTGQIFNFYVYGHNLLV